MSSVKFSVGSPLTHRTGCLELPGLVHQIQVDLEDGDHTFTSPDFKLGTVHLEGRRALIGRLTFRYSFDEKNQVITICGTDYPSVDGMALITTPEGSNQLCTEHAASAGFAAEEVYSSSGWNYHSQMMPEAAKIIKDIARAANDALITALIGLDKFIVRRREQLPELAMEHYLALCAVSRNGQFLEPFDPTHEYEADDIVRLPESQYGGVVAWPTSLPFANVIGSTDDPKPDGFTSWKQLWSTKVGITASTCTSLSFPVGFQCNLSLIYGGHIIQGQTASRVAAGSNDVYIFPICVAHNNDDSIYMSCQTYNTAVWLVNYQH
jgi:hypothetical protein